MSSNPLTEADLQYLKDVLTDPTTGSLIMIGSLLFNLAWLFGMKASEWWVEKQPWWDNAKKLQAALLMNFGYREEDCTDKSCLEMYCLTIAGCSHHAICGLMVLPVIISGGRSGYIPFVICCIADLGLDVVDWLRMAMTLCCAEALNMAPTPPQMFFIMGVLHHGLCIIMVMPMLLNYMTMPEFHYIVCSLLIAAGIAYTTGAYKFTLDTSQPSGFHQYKAIVVIQLVSIWASRGFIWFYCIVQVLRNIAADGANTFWWGALVCGIMMSLFNALMLMDCTTAAIKWLPRAMPQSDEEKKELQKAMTSDHIDLPRAASRLAVSSSVREAALRDPMVEPVEVGEVRP